MAQDNDQNLPVDPERTIINPRRGPGQGAASANTGAANAASAHAGARTPAARNSGAAGQNVPQPPQFVQPSAPIQRPQQQGPWPSAQAGFPQQYQGNRQPQQQSGYGPAQEAPNLAQYAVGGGQNGGMVGNYPGSGNAGGVPPKRTSNGKIAGIVLGSLAVVAILTTIFFAGVLPALSDEDDDAASASTSESVSPSQVAAGPSVAAVSTPSAAVADPSVSVASTPATNLTTNCTSIVGEAASLSNDDLESGEIVSDEGDTSANPPAQDSTITNGELINNNQRVTCLVEYGDTTVTITVYSLSADQDSQVSIPPGNGKAERIQDFEGVNPYRSHSNRAAYYKSSANTSNDPVLIKTSYDNKKDAPTGVIEEVVLSHGWVA